MEALLEEDETMVVWWATRVECVSAITRRIREGILGEEDEELSRTALGTLAEGWSEMQPTTRLRLLAERLLAKHPLRAADALQLAAALRWRGEQEEGRLVCLDTRLREAAREEGFSVMPDLPERHPSAASGT